MRVGATHEAEAIGASVASLWGPREALSGHAVNTIFVGTFGGLHLPTAFAVFRDMGVKYFNNKHLHVSSKREVCKLPVLPF
jgi:hypothetical protein